MRTTVPPSRKGPHASFLALPHRSRCCVSGGHSILVGGQTSAGCAIVRVLPPQCQARGLAARRSISSRLLDSDQNSALLEWKGGVLPRGGLEVDDREPALGVALEEIERADEVPVETSPVSGGSDSPGTASRR